MCTPFCAGSRSTKQSMSAEISFSRAAPAQADRLCDALHPGAREAELHFGRRSLQVVRGAPVTRSCDERLVSGRHVGIQTPVFRGFVSLAAHDLRTPLATIHGFAQTSCA